MKSTRSPRSQAHFSVASALDEVQTVPPRSPTNALIDAAELMYVTGTIDVTPICSRSAQHISSCSGAAMSAIEQPAARSGRITC